jgi:hypothetical protein
MAISRNTGSVVKILLPGVLFDREAISKKHPGFFQKRNPDEKSVL